jgi:hypothetical protein
MYGCEIWGWTECKKLEALQLTYIKWCLESDRNVPGYVVLEETGVDKMRV